MQYKGHAKSWALAHESHKQVASSAAGSAKASKANVEHRGRRLKGERQERVQGGMALIIQGERMVQ